jgi:MFS superfamily sulfate permease-like transporter
VVIVYSIGLIDAAGFGPSAQCGGWVPLGTGGDGRVVLLGTLQGILVAIVVSLIALAQQAASPPVHVLGRKPGTNVFRPRTEEHPEDETFPGLLLLRVEGRIFFLNAARIGEKIQPLLEELHNT